jgi:hypothetical protein
VLYSLSADAFSVSQSTAALSITSPNAGKQVQTQIRLMTLKEEDAILIELAKILYGQYIKHKEFQPQVRNIEHMLRAEAL